MPWRSQVSSCARFLSNFSSCTASLASDSSFFCTNVCVVARPGREPSAIQFDDPRGEALQKGAVVGDEHDRAAVVGQEVFQPEIASMSRWLVGSSSSSSIRLDHQRASQQDAASPAAGQRVNGDRPVEAKARQDEVDLVLATPVLRVVSRQCGEPFSHDVEDRLRRRERHILFEPRHPQRGLVPDAAGVRRQFAADDLQQGRLAGTVASDDRYALPRLELQRHVVEEWQVAECVVDVVECQKGHRERNC